MTDVTVYALFSSIFQKVYLPKDLDSIICYSKSFQNVLSIHPAEHLISSYIQQNTVCPVFLRYQDQLGTPMSKEDMAAYFRDYYKKLRTGLLKQLEDHKK